MQAALVPAVSGFLQVKDVPQPKPGSNQVLVKTHASGICYTDVHETLAHIPGEFPRILGHEPVGEIVAVALTFQSEKLATGWAPRGFKKPADAACGTSAKSGCFARTRKAPV